MLRELRERRKNSQNEGEKDGRTDRASVNGPPHPMWPVARAMRAARSGHACLCVVADSEVLGHRHDYGVCIIGFQAQVNPGFDEVQEWEGKLAGDGTKKCREYSPRL